LAEKKTLSAKEVVADIRAGATDEFLIAKYGISQKGLQNLFQKLLTANLITQADLDSRVSVEKAKVVVNEEDGAKPPRPIEDGPVLKPSTSISQQSRAASTDPEKPSKQPDPPITKGHRKERRIFKWIIIGAVLVGVITIPALILPITALLGLFIDFAVNVGVWLLICCLVAFIIAKIRKAETTNTYFQKAAWVALIIAVLATIPSITKTFQMFGRQPASSAQLTDQQARRFQEIIKGAMSNPSYLTPSVRQEFREMLTKMGGTPEQIQHLREKMTGLVTTYQPLFWQDALIAFQTGKPHKSQRREDYEKRIIAKGLVSTERINNNNILMSKIAARESLPWQGQQVVLDEDAIRGILDNVQETAARIDRLFSSAGK
jgi:hypothetical protein